MLKPFGRVLEARGTEMELLLCWWVAAGVLMGEEEAALVGEAAEALRGCSLPMTGSFGSSLGVPDLRRRDPTLRHSARPSSIIELEVASFLLALYNTSCINSLFLCHMCLKSLCSTLRSSQFSRVTMVERRGASVSTDSPKLAPAVICPMVPPFGLTW